MEPLRLRRLASNQLPQLWATGHPGDAGVDLFCADSFCIQPSQFLDVCLGVEVQLPQGYWGMLTGRSSTLRRHQLMVNQAVIDQGYRGRLFAGIWNLGQEAVWILAGTRLAQLILLPLWAPGRPPVVEVDSLDSSARGSSGFGSTGT